MRKTVSHAYRPMGVSIPYSFRHDLHRPKRGHLVEVRTSFDLRPTSRGRKFTPLYTLRHTASSKPMINTIMLDQSPPRLHLPRHLDQHDDTHVEMDPRDTEGYDMDDKALLALQIMYLSSVLKDGYGSLESGDLSPHIELTTTMRATTITMIHSEDGSHTVTTLLSSIAFCAQPSSFRCSRGRSS
jgi:hypothetical protein